MFGRLEDREWRDADGDAQRVRQPRRVRLLDRPGYVGLPAATTTGADRSAAGKAKAAKQAAVATLMADNAASAQH